MPNVGDVVIELRGKVDNLESAMQRANRSIATVPEAAAKASASTGASLATIGPKLASIATTAAGVAGAITAAAATITAATVGIAVAMSRPLRAVAELKDRADSLGESAKSLSQLEFALGQIGIKGEMSQRVLVSMAQKMDEAKDKSSRASLVFRALGVDIDNGLINALTSFTTKLSTMGDRQQAIALSSEVFGKRVGASILRLGPDFAALSKMSDETGATVSNAFADAGDAVDDAFERMGNAIEGFKRGVVEPLAPSLVKATDNLTRFFAVNPQGIAVAREITAQFGTTIERLTKPENLERLGAIATDLAKVGGGIASISSALIIPAFENVINKMAQIVSLMEQAADISGKIGKGYEIGGEAVGSAVTDSFTVSSNRRYNTVGNRIVPETDDEVRARLYKKAHPNASMDIYDGPAPAVDKAAVFDIADTTGPADKPALGDYPQAMRALLNEDPKVRAASAQAEVARLEAQRASLQDIVELKQKAADISREQGQTDADAVKSLDEIKQAQLAVIDYDERILRARINAARAQLTPASDRDTAEDVAARQTATGEIRALEIEILGIANKRAAVNQADSLERLKAAKDQIEIARAFAASRVASAQNQVSDLSARLQIARSDRTGTLPDAQEIALARQLDQAEQASLDRQREAKQIEIDRLEKKREANQLSDLEGAQLEQLTVDMEGFNLAASRGPQHFAELNRELLKAHNTISTISALIDLLFSGGSTHALENVGKQALNQMVQRAKESADNGDSAADVFRAFRGDSGGSSGGSSSDAISAIRKVYDAYAGSQVATTGAAGADVGAAPASYEAGVGGSSIVGADGAGATAVTDASGAQIGLGAETAGGSATGAAGGGFGGAMGWVGAAFEIAKLINSFFSYADERKKRVEAAKEKPGVSQADIIDANMNTIPIVGSYFETGNQLTNNIFGRKLGSEINMNLLTAGGAKMLDLAGVHMFQAPTGEAQLSRALRRYTDEVGIPRVLSDTRGVNTRPYGIKGGPKLEPSEEIKALRYRADEAGGLFNVEFDHTKMPERSLLPARTANFLENTATALKYSGAEYDRLIKKFQQPLLGQNFEEATMKLASLRVKPMGMPMDDEKFTSMLGRTLQVYQDLPNAIDAATIAQAAFTKTGALDFERMTHAAEDAKAVIVDGGKDLFQTLVDGARPELAAQDLSRRFVTTMVERIGEEMADKMLAKTLSEAVVTGEKAIELAMSGDREGAKVLFDKAREQINTGAKETIGFIGPLAGDMRAMLQSVNRTPVGGLVNQQAQGTGYARRSNVVESDFSMPSYDVGGFVPRDMVAQVHQGELITTAGDTREMVGLLRGIFGAVSRSGSTPEIHLSIDGVAVETSINRNRKMQRSPGLNLPKKGGK